MNHPVDPALADLVVRAADDHWPRAHEALGSATFRSCPEDFRVQEQLGFEPDGEGEFALVRVEKTGRNTADVAQDLARLAGVPGRAVGWAGRKDRVAVAEQWFCVHLPGRDGPQWHEASGEGWRVVAAHRHRRKLRVGALAANRFEIVLRDAPLDADALAARVAQIAEAGVPNYFGPQRFGRGGANITAALQASGSDRSGRGRGRKHGQKRGQKRGRKARGMALSAARSALFNEILAARVRDGSWQGVLPGEVLMLRRSRSVFGPEPGGEEALAALDARVAAGEIDPTGALWGRGELPCDGPARALEQGSLAPYESLRSVLEEAGLRQERRRLRLVPAGLQAVPLDGTTWQLCFQLEAGAFATSIVRELIDPRGATEPA